jgi:hypothetical protein
MAVPWQDFDRVRGWRKLVLQGCSSPLVVKFADTQKEKDQKRLQQMHANLWNLSALTPQYLTVSFNPCCTRWVSLLFAPLPQVPVALKLCLVCGCNSQLLQQMQQQTQPQAQSSGAATSPATLLASMQQLMGMQQLQAANSGQSYSKYSFFYLF